MIFILYGILGVIAVFIIFDLFGDDDGQAF